MQLQGCYWGTLKQQRQQQQRRQQQTEGPAVVGGLAREGRGRRWEGRGEGDSKRHFQRHVYVSRTIYSTQQKNKQQSAGCRCCSMYWKYDIGFPLLPPPPPPSPYPNKMFVVTDFKFKHNNNNTRTNTKIPPPQKKKKKKKTKPKNQTNPKNNNNKQTNK